MFKMCRTPAGIVGEYAREFAGIRPERNQGHELVYANIATCCCRNAAHPEFIVGDEGECLSLLADMPDRMHTPLGSLSAKAKRTMTIVRPPRVELAAKTSTRVTDRMERRER